MINKEKILIVDDDQTFANILMRAFERRELDTKAAHNEEEALKINQEFMPAKLVLDLKLGRESGLHLIEKLLVNNPELKIVMLTGYSSISTAVEAIKLGACNYLCKPASTEEILSAFESDKNNAPVEIPKTPPSVNRIEWEHIQKVLNENQGNISATARALGMHRRTLQRKLQKRPVSH